MIWWSSKAQWVPEKLTGRPIDKGQVRFGLSLFNTGAEIKAAVRAVSCILYRQRKKIINLPSFQWWFRFLPVPSISKESDSSKDHKKSENLAHRKRAEDEAQVGIRLSEEFHKKTKYPVKK